MYVYLYIYKTLLNSFGRKNVKHISLVRILDFHKTHIHPHFHQCHDVITDDRRH